MQFTQEAAYFSNSTAFPSSTTNFSMAFWWRIDQLHDGLTHRDYYELQSNSWAEGQPAWSFGRWTSAEFYFEPFNGDSAWDPDDYLDLNMGVPGSTLVIGQWYHIAYVKEGSSHKLYRDGVVVDSGTLVQPANSNGWTNSFEFIGVGEWGGTQQPGHSLAELRQWTAALTEAEVQAEMASRLLVKTADIFRSVQFGGIDGTDVSGQARHLTLGGANQATGVQAVTGPRGSASMSPSASDSRSPSASLSPSASASVSPSASESQSPSASVSPSASESVSPSASDSPSSSTSPSASVSPS